MTRFARHGLMLITLLAAAAVVPNARTYAADKAPAAAAASFEVYQDKGGEFRWRLRAQNGQVIATSGDGYKEKRACLAGIESVKKHAGDAPVKDAVAAPEK